MASLAGTRISSSLTVPYKILGGMIGPGNIIAAIALVNHNPFVTLLGGVLGVWYLVIWWRYLRVAARVTMDDEGLWVEGKPVPERRIRYSQVISIAQKPGLYTKAILIKYKDGKAERQLSFFPSLEVGGWCFTADRIEDLIRRRLSMLGK